MLNTTHKCTWGAVLTLVALCGTSAMAQDTDAFKEMIVKNMRANPETVLDMTEKQMKRVTPTGDISAAILETYTRDRVAYEHALMLGRVLTLDRDFDGGISGDEWAATLSPRIESATPRYLLEEADADGDGTRSNAEIRAAVSAHVMSSQGFPRDVERAEELKDFLIFDQDGDGTVTVVEMRAAMTALAVE